MSKGAPGVRYAECERNHGEIRAQIVLDLDGGERRDIKTGLRIFDDLLDQMAHAARINLGLTIEGAHPETSHQVLELAGALLGTALRQALHESDPVERMGDATVPVDDALAQVALDLRGIGAAYLSLEFARERFGDLALDSVAGFFRSLAAHGGMTLHVMRLAGATDHNVCQAAFRALGRALNGATLKLDRANGAGGKHAGHMR